MTSSFRSFRRETNPVDVLTHGQTKMLIAMMIMMLSSLRFVYQWYLSVLCPPLQVFLFLLFHPLKIRNKNIKIKKCHLYQFWFVLFNFFVKVLFPWYANTYIIRSSFLFTRKLGQFIVKCFCTRMTQLRVERGNYLASPRIQTFLVPLNSCLACFDWTMQVSLLLIKHKESS